MADANLDRLYRGCKTRAADSMSHRGFQALGPRLRRALVAEEILILLDQQDSDGVSNATVRQLLTDLRQQLTSDGMLAE